MEVQAFFEVIHDWLNLSWRAEGTECWIDDNLGILLNQSALTPVLSNLGHDLMVRLPGCLRIQRQVTI